MSYSADSKPLAVAGPPRARDRDATVMAARDLLGRTAESPGSRRSLQYLPGVEETAASCIK